LVGPAACWGELSVTVLVRRAPRGQARQPSHRARAASRLREHMSLSPLDLSRAAAAPRPLGAARRVQYVLASSSRTLCLKNMLPLASKAPPVGV